MPDKTDDPCQEVPTIAGLVSLRSELIRPGTALHRHLLRVADMYHSHLRYEFLRSFLGDGLARMFFGHYDRLQVGWPVPGRWDFVAVEYIWGLFCEASRWRSEMQGGANSGIEYRHISRSLNGRFELTGEFLQSLQHGGCDAAAGTDLVRPITSDAKMARRLFLEAIFFHWLQDLACAPHIRKGCVIEELIGGLPSALANFGIVLEAMPDIQVLDGDKSGAVFEGGSAYRVSFRDPDQNETTLTAYCLGCVGIEPVFELDATALPTVTQFSLGEECQIGEILGSFVGLTLSGRPVFITKDGEPYIHTDSSLITCQR